MLTSPRPRTIVKRALYAALSTALLISTGASTRAPAGPGRAPGKPRVGVFYFPGWIDSPWAPSGGWKPIQAYPERKPLLGWYRPAAPEVIAQQVEWMHDYGIDYVVFDWFFGHGEVRLDEPLNTYLSLPHPPVDVSLLWANHDDPVTPATLQTIVRTWITRYFVHPRYMKVDGKPVVFLVSFDRLRDDAIASGTTVKAYIDTAQAMARRAGLPGIYFVAGTDDSATYNVRVEAVQAGFSAISAYNLHRKPVTASAVDPVNWGRVSHSYAELDADYRQQWAQGLKLDIPYVVPMSAGWDRRPWGGSVDPLHDRSIGTAAQFRTHLAAGRAAMAAQARKGPALGVICCWNEFGEGSYIEPTVGTHFRRLDQVKAVFGR